MAINEEDLTLSYPFKVELMQGQGPVFSARSLIPSLENMGSFNDERDR